jgi:hypothetical protein
MNFFCNAVGECVLELIYLERYHLLYSEKLIVGDSSFRGTKSLSLLLFKGSNMLVMMHRTHIGVHPFASNCSAILYISCRNNLQPPEGLVETGSPLF